MITSLSVKNFKILKEEHFQFTPLNLITGLNGMGKSSLIQVLLLLRQTHRYGKVLGTLVLQGDLVNVGRGKDVLCQYAEEDLIDIQLSIGGMAMRSVSAYSPESDVLMALEGSSTPNDVREFALFNENFHYLYAEHTAPKFSYSKSITTVVDKKQIGIRGEYAIHYLHTHGNKDKVPPILRHNSGEEQNTLLQQVNLWLSEITPGTRLSTADFGGIDEVVAYYQFHTHRNEYTNPFSPPNVGFGLSYTLPVIVALLTAQPGKLIIIENPESHLHPRAQSKMGELIARATQAGAQIFVETHSDHLLNGVRLAVKKGLLDHTKTSMFFFRRTENDDNRHSLAIDQPTIDKDGGIEHWPNDFFDQATKDLKELFGL